MNVFVLGGTGSIGTELTKELVARAHSVAALSRSSKSDLKLQTLGAKPVRGDITMPEPWLQLAIESDALVHVASTFEDNMREIDQRIIDGLVQQLSQTDKTLRLLYTGGCWLYGETRERVANEESLFTAVSPYQWMANFSNRLLRERQLNTVIVHPAMVYTEEGGVFEDFLASALAKRPLEIWGESDVRWPLVEGSDLAKAYCDLLERPGLSGHYNVASQEGVWVSEIVETFMRSYGVTAAPLSLNIQYLIKEYGAWAVGPTMDQQMSSEKLRAHTAWRPSITDYRRFAVVRRRAGLEE
jgi:nucleoside-diphosphate-sugar epimerase